MLFFTCVFPDSCKVNTYHYLISYQSVMKLIFLKVLGDYTFEYTFISILADFINKRSRLFFQLG